MCHCIVPCTVCQVFTRLFVTNLHEVVTFSVEVWSATPVCVALGAFKESSRRWRSKSLMQGIDPHSPSKKRLAIFVGASQRRQRIARGGVAEAVALLPPYALLWASCPLLVDRRLTGLAYLWYCRSRCDPGLGCQFVKMHFYRPAHCLPTRAYPYFVTELACGVRRKYPRVAMITAFWPYVTCELCLAVRMRERLDRG